MSDDELDQMLKARLPRHTAPAALTERLEVLDAVLGDDAGLVGSALLAARGVSTIHPAGA